MKKIISSFALALCVILGTVSLTACGNEIRWLRPNFTYAGDGITVKFVNNEKKDFEFPIEGLKLDHSNFTSQRTFEYSWVLYNDAQEIVGWIEAGNGYDFNNKNRYYGFSTTIVNGVNGYENTTFVVVLKSTDFTIFDNLKITTDRGSVSVLTEADQNPISATKRYMYYDEASNQEVPRAGSEKFVCCFYSLKLASINPKKAKTINLTLSLKDE